MARFRLAAAAEHLQARREQEGSELHQVGNSWLLDCSTDNVSSDVFLCVFSFPLRVFSPSFDWAGLVCLRSFESLPRSVLSFLE